MSLYYGKAISLGDFSQIYFYVKNNPLKNYSMHILLDVIPFSKKPYWEGKRTSIKPFVTCGVEERSILFETRKEGL